MYKRQVYDLPTPQNTTNGGVELLRRLNRWNPEQTTDLTITAARELYKDWENQELTKDVGLLHLENLPKILISCRPQDEAFMAAFVNISAHTNPNTQTQAIINQARSIAKDILRQARRQNLLKANGLTHDVSFFFLETLYCHLLRNKSFINSAQPIFKHCLQTCSELKAQKHLKNQFGIQKNASILPKALERGTRTVTTKTNAKPHLQSAPPALPPSYQRENAVEVISEDTSDHASKDDKKYDTPLRMEQQQDLTVTEKLAKRIAAQTSSVAKNNNHINRDKTGHRKHSDAPQDRGNDYLFRLRASMRQSNAEKTQKSWPARRLFG